MTKTAFITLGQQLGRLMKVKNMKYLSTILDTLLSIFAFVVGVFCFLEMDYFPIFSNIPIGGDVNLNQGKSIRNWFLLVLGLATTEIFVCNFILSVNDSTSFLEYYLDDNLFRYSIYLFFRYLPSITFLSSYSIGAIYFFELSINDGSESTLTSTIAYAQYASLMFFSLFLVIVFIPSLHFALFWSFVIEYIFMFLMVGWSGRGILLKLPRNFLIPSRSSQISSAQLYKKLQPMYITSMTSISLILLYYILVATNTIPSIRHDDEGYDVIYYFLPILFSQIIGPFMILMIVAKPHDQKFSLFSIIIYIKSKIYNYGGRSNSYRQVPSEQNIPVISYSTFSQSPSRPIDSI